MLFYEYVVHYSLDFKCLKCSNFCHYHKLNILMLIYIAYCIIDTGDTKIQTYTIYFQKGFGDY